MSQASAQTVPVVVEQISNARRIQTPMGGMPRVATYEELDGGNGREIHFRPDRYRRSDLGSVEPVVRVTAMGAVHTCGLVDISQNGLAFRCPPELQVKA